MDSISLTSQGLISADSNSATNKRPRQKGDSYRTGQDGRRVEVRYRPASRVELRISKDHDVLYKGFKAGKHRYEYLTYVDTTQEKDMWLNEKKADFNCLKAETTLLCMRDSGITRIDSGGSSGDANKTRKVGPQGPNDLKPSASHHHIFESSTSPALFGPTGTLAQVSHSCSGQTSTMGIGAATTPDPLQQPLIVHVIRNAATGTLGFGVVGGGGGRVVVATVATPPTSSWSSSSDYASSPSFASALQVGDRLLAVKRLSRIQPSAASALPHASSSALFRNAPAVHAFADESPASAADIAVRTMDCDSNEEEEEGYNDVYEAGENHQEGGDNKKVKTMKLCEDARHWQMDEEAEGWAPVTSANAMQSFIEQAWASKEATAFAFKVERAENNNNNNNNNNNIDGSGQGPRRGLREVSRSSRFKGVFYYRGSLTGRHWEANAGRQRGQRGAKLLHLGYFKSEEEAARRYDQHAGPLGRDVNFPSAPWHKQARKAVAASSASSSSFSSNKQPYEPVGFRSSGSRSVTPPPMQHDASASAIAGLASSLTLDIGCQTESFVRLFGAPVMKNVTLNDPRLITNAAVVTKNLTRPVADDIAAAFLATIKTTKAGALIKFLPDRKAV